MAAVGTEGGPVLVVSARAVDAWEGASAALGEPDDAMDDYSRACDAVSEDDFATIDVGGTRGLVASLPHCSFATLGNDALLVASGSELQIELAYNERGGTAKLPHAIDVGADGVVLLDAAFEAKRAPDGGMVRAKLAPGTYDVEIHRVNTASGLVLYARLSASASKSSKKKSFKKKSSKKKSSKKKSSKKKSSKKKSSKS